MPSTSFHAASECGEIPCRTIPRTKIYELTLITYTLQFVCQGFFWACAHNFMTGPNAAAALPLHRGLYYTVGSKRRRSFYKFDPREALSTVQAWRERLGRPDGERPAPTEQIVRGFQAPRDFAGAAQRFCAAARHQGDEAAWADCENRRHEALWEVFSRLGAAARDATQRRRAPVVYLNLKLQDPACGQ